MMRSNRYEPAASTDPKSFWEPKRNKFTTDLRKVITIIYLVILVLIFSACSSGTIELIFPRFYIITLAGFIVSIVGGYVVSINIIQRTIFFEWKKSERQKKIDYALTMNFLSSFFFFLSFSLFLGAYTAIIEDISLLIVFIFALGGCLFFYDALKPYFNAVEIDWHEIGNPPTEYEED